MKKIFCLILVGIMLLLCACASEESENVDSQIIVDDSESRDNDASENELTDEKSQTPETSRQADTSNPALDGDDLEAENKTYKPRYVPESKNAEKLTEEECEKLAYDMYADVLSIAKEFYGFPDYLFSTPGKMHKSFESLDPSKSGYFEVRYFDNESASSTIKFKPDVKMLNEVLNNYFTDDLINLAFSLKYPCPILVDNGVMYRAEYEPPTAETVCDISAGRVISRDKGVVRYGFPIYYIDYDTEEIDESFWFLGYMDFVYEDEQWKINDFRLSREAYNEDLFPGSLVDIRMDDFFDIDDSATLDNIKVELKGDKNVTVSVDGKKADFKLEKKASKIEKIEQSNDNIFVSFLGIANEMETLVVSKTDLKLNASFVANAYCVNENGDWFYLIINRDTKTCDIYDKADSAIYGVSVIRQPKTKEFGLPEIAPIDELKYEDGKFSVVYDLTGYLQDK